MKKNSYENFKKSLDYGLGILDRACIFRINIWHYTWHNGVVRISKYWLSKNLNFLTNYYFFINFFGSCRFEDGFYTSSSCWWRIRKQIEKIFNRSFKKPCFVLLLVTFYIEKTFVRKFQQVARLRSRNIGSSWNFQDNHMTLCLIQWCCRNFKILSLKKS